MSKIINRLASKGRNIICIAKISFLKKEGITKKISYERRVYESVNDKSLS